MVYSQPRHSTLILDSELGTIDNLNGLLTRELHLPFGDGKRLETIDNLNGLLTQKIDLYCVDQDC